MAAPGSVHLHALIIRFWYVGNIDDTDYLDLAPVGNPAIPGAEIQIWEDSSRIYARTIFRGHTSVTTTVL